jgi:hypothetical protein
VTVNPSGIFDTDIKNAEFQEAAFQQHNIIHRMVADGWKLGDQTLAPCFGRSLASYRRWNLHEG